jgi:hypothetical protein
MFYKKENDELLSAPNFVAMPDITLTAEEKDQHTYPINGWYWFDTLDDAISFYAKPATDSITPRQIRLQLSAIGMRQVVEDYVATSSLDIKDWWEFSTFFERDNALLVEVATKLGMTSEQLDQFFAEASKL